MRATGWPPCLELQEALRSSPSASSAPALRSLRAGPYSLLQDRPFAPPSHWPLFTWPVLHALPTLPPGPQACILFAGQPLPLGTSGPTPSGKASLTFHQPTRSLFYNLEPRSGTTGLWVWPGELLRAGALRGQRHVHGSWQHRVRGSVSGVLVGEGGQGMGWMEGEMSAVA